MRYLYLDNLRAILMVLGLVLHTCAAFSSPQYWLVTYTQPLAWANDLSNAIHVFRMPLFFMISGFFAFILLKKQTIKHFCSTKVMRIGLPLLSVLILINIPQFYLLKHVSSSPGNEYINAGSIKGHLWFLINLLVYFWVYAGIHFFVVRIRVPANNALLPIFVLLFLLLMPIFHLSLLGLNKIGIPIYVNIPIFGSIYSVFSYFDYFLIGAIFALITHDRIMEFFKSLRFLIVLLPLLVIAALPWWQPTVVNNISAPYINHIQATIVSICIWLVSSYVLSSNSSWMRGLADASYSIYLFHHAAIVALVYGLNRVNIATSEVINPYMAFFSVMLLSFCFTLIVHYLVITKSSKFRLMFNGK